MTAMVSTWPKSLLTLLVLTSTLFACSSEATDLLLTDTDTEITSDETATENDEPGTDDETDSESTDDNTDESTDDTTEDENSDTTNDDQDDADEGDTPDDTDTAPTCTNPLNFVFNEANGVVMAEFENAEFSGAWALKANGNKYTGKGYMEWQGQQYFNDPGNGTASFKIKITNPGTYRFLWYNAVKKGTDGTEHNDTWLRFSDAADFYGQKGTGSKVYPKGSGKSPNPNGASKDGWLKIYRSGNNLDFIWQARTSDHDAHDIYVKFNNPGTYTMEVSARSSGHAIDKFVLFKNGISQGEATAMAASAITCD